jgi:transcriptional regulator of acetoin/glycerol metabolism
MPSRDGETPAHEDDIFAFVANLPGKRPPNPEIPLIGESWRRCVERYRLDPARGGQPRILTTRELKDHREPIDAFARLARTEIARLYRQVADAGLVVLLTNMQGVTIEYRGDPALESDLKASGLYLGSVWAEDVEGTNGVGTCIATGVPLTVFRDEHFRTRNTGLTCTVAPIRDPSGALMAVLDVSSMKETTRESQHLALQLVRAAARRLERAYLHQQFPRHWKLRLGSADAREGQEEILLIADEAGRVIAADGAAFDGGLLDTSQGLIGSDLDAVLETPPELERIARDGDGWQGYLRHEGRPVDLRVRPPERPPATIKKRADAPIGRAKPTARPDLWELACGEAHLTPQVRKLDRLLDRDIPILLQGETGTGKEAFARAIHDAGRRSGAAFVAVNCAAIPESLIESELFGYCAGAFTGARRQGMPGRVVEADGGTLFLDEVGDMSLDLQTRLLRVLAEHEVVPLGGGRPRQVDFHLICATHQDLDALVDQGRFRADLYYRLQGFTLSLPPVRARSDRKELIARLLAREATATGCDARLDPAAMACLAAYPWPGNVRELRSVLQVALALADGGTIALDHLPPRIAQASDRSHGEVVDEMAAKGEVLDGADQRVETLTALQREGWCVARTARRLGVSRATVHRRIRAYGLVSPNKRGARA